MPVTLRHTLPGCSFALWRIDEDTARLASLCTGQENAWVSHAGGYAALMLCDVPCGLDIERADRDFTKTEERFLAPDERKLLESAGGLSAGIVWCAKEALYKWSGLGGLDWLRDIRVTKIDPVRETLEGTAGGKRIGLKVIPHPELHIVFCAG